MKNLINKNKKKIRISLLISFIIAIVFLFLIKIKIINISCTVKYLNPWQHFLNVICFIVIMLLFYLL